MHHKKVVLLLCRFALCLYLFVFLSLVDWKDVFSAVFSCIGTIAGLGCMINTDREQAVHIGGIASTTVGAVTGAYAGKMMLLKYANQKKVHTM